MQHADGTVERTIAVYAVDAQLGAAAAAGLEASAGIVPVLLRTANGTVQAQTAQVGELRLGNIVARKRSTAPAEGDRAIPSKTPTLTSASGDVTALTTSRRPDRELYTTSVAQALAVDEPFVIAFATPQFCQSRTCGPVVDVVSSVRKEKASAGVRFIHVEIYEDNDPTKGQNSWVREWKLPSEPWVFVVGADGKIADRFEGTVSVRELDEAVGALR